MIQVRAFKEPYRGRGMALWIEDVDGQVVRVAEPIVFRRLDSSEIWKQDERPPLTICPEAGQKLMDDLWDCGLRPSEGTGSAGQLASVQRHLADMRVIVEKELKLKF